MGEQFYHLFNNSIFESLHFSKDVPLSNFVMHVYVLHIFTLFISFTDINLQLQQWIFQVHNRIVEFSRIIRIRNN